MVLKGECQTKKQFHKAEKEWLSGINNPEKRRQKRAIYLEKRRRYKKAIVRAKRNYEENKGMELDSLIRNQRKWCKMVKKMKIGGKQGRQTDVSKVYDKEGVARMGEVKGETFIRLMEAQVQSVLLYGAEVRVVAES